MRKSKFFRVAVEGATTDGRKIDRKWLEEIAQTYNRSKYGARIFVEHIRGLSPDSSFRCMGDVIAVKAEEVEIDGQKRLALFAQIEPTAEMVELTKGKQKIYSSIEVNPDFADSGKAYLMGLGITDSPASLGTEILAFAAQNPDANPFATRKQSKDNVFTAAELAEIEFEEETQAGPSLFARVKELLAGKSKTDDERYSDMSRAMEEVATAASEATAQVESLSSEVGTLREELATARREAKEQIEELSRRVDTTPNNDPPRPPATGPAGGVVTDC